MGLTQLASETATYLTRELELDTGKADNLRFGLEIIFGALIKGAILFSLACFFGIFPEVAFAMVSGSLFRLLSGGAHCSGYWRCLSLGLLIYLGAGELGLYLQHYISIGFLIYSLMDGYLLFCVCVLAWAPGEVPFKKTTKISERFLFKFLSITYLSFWLGVSLLIMHNYYPSLVLAGFIAVLAQTITFTPPGYKAIHKIDSFLAGLFKGKEVPHYDADS